MLVIVITTANALKAQHETSTQPTPDLSEMGLTELMNMEISIASVTKLTARESPGIVTVITQSDIKNSGAIDLQEVLALVPGFDFGVDVEGVVGIGIRGNWAHEGKVLMLIDGHEVNEGLYSTLQMGLHYPVANIERIEIIRGPGSAIYGGSAAYAVINIISQSANNFKGTSASLWNSMFKNTRASSGIEMYAGNTFKNGMFNISAGVSNGIRSDKTYTDVYNNSYDMADFSTIKNKYVNTLLNVRGYNLQFMYNQHIINTRDAYDVIFTESYPSSFTSYHGNVSKKYFLAKKLSVTPTISYKHQTPWCYTGPSYENEFVPYRLELDKYTANLQLNFDASRWLNLTGGAEYFSETARNKTGEMFLSTQTKKLSQDNYSFFAQSLARTSVINFTAGCRYTHNMLYGSSFVPRAGITRAWDKFHIKALLSRAFRSPSIENMDLNTELKPETSTIVELEAGFIVSENMDIIINGFDILTKEPILYYYNESGNEDDYINGYRSGTKGFEVEVRHKSKNMYIAANYSFYSTKEKNVVANYEVPVNHDVMLAFPAHKAAVWGHVNITSVFNIYSSFLFKGPRYGIISYSDETGETEYKKFAPVYLFNIMLNCNKVFVKNFTVGAGVKNIFNANDVIIQPYNNLHAPLPGSSRQYCIKAAYVFDFKK